MSWMNTLRVKNLNRHAIIFFFRFDEEVTLGNLRFADMLKALQLKHLTEFGRYTFGEPMFATAEWVKDFKE